MSEISSEGMEKDKEGGGSGKGPKEVLLEDSDTEGSDRSAMDTGNVSSVEAIAGGVRTSETRSVGDEEVFYTPQHQRKRSRSFSGSPGEGPGKLTPVDPMSELRMETQGMITKVARNEIKKIRDEIASKEVEFQKWSQVSKMSTKAVAYVRTRMVENKRMVERLLWVMDTEVRTIMARNRYALHEAMAAKSEVQEKMTVELDKMKEYMDKCESERNEKQEKFMAEIRNLLELQNKGVKKVEDVTKQEAARVIKFSEEHTKIVGNGLAKVLNVSQRSVDKIQNVDDRAKAIHQDVKEVKSSVIDMDDSVKKVSGEAIKDSMKEVSIVVSEVNKMMKGDEWAKGMKEVNETLKAVKDSMEGGEWTSVGGKEKKKKKCTLPETYAERVRSMQDDTKVKVAIRKEGETVDSMSKLLKEKVNPKDLGLNVESIRGIKNGIIVEVNSKDEGKVLELVKSSVGGNVEVKGVKGIDPLVRVVGVDEDEKDECICEEIWARNFASVYEKEEWMQSVKVVRSMKLRNAREKTVLLRVSSRVRSDMIERENVYVGWRRCVVKDYVEVYMCFKCCGYGHSGKECKRDAVCHKCGEKGHLRKDCKSEGTRCPNCIRAKLPAEHAVNSKGCPIFEKEMVFQVKKTEWSTNKV